MNQLPRKAANENDLAAEQSETADKPVGNHLSERAVQCSDDAYELEKEAYNESFQILNPDCPPASAQAAKIITVPVVVKE